MLNCSYNFGLRKIKAFIRKYPVGTADEIAEMINEFNPVARAFNRCSKSKNHHFWPSSTRFLCLQCSNQTTYDLGVNFKKTPNLIYLFLIKNMLMTHALMISLKIWLKKWAQLIHIQIFFKVPWLNMN